MISAYWYNKQHSDRNNYTDNTSWVRRKKSAIPCLLLFLSLITVSCTQSIRHYTLYNDLLMAEDFTQGVQVIKENQEKYSEKNRLLFLLDMGISYHYAKEYDKSIQYLLEAEDLIDLLYTKSLSTEAASMITSDNILPYDGEDFEKVLVNIFLALNYIMQGKNEGALVEARKVEHKLIVMNDAYEKKNIYKDDALAHYLSGLLYERNGDVNDALISYHKAYDAFISYRRAYKTPFPNPLKQDILRTADALHLDEEIKKLKKHYQINSWDDYKKRKDAAELIIFSYTGLSPIKYDRYIDAPIADGEGGVYILRIAFPKFQKRETLTSGCEVRIAGNVHPCYLMEDIESIALKNLDDRISRISAKAIVRAGTKYLAARTIRDRAAQLDNPVATFVADIATDAYSIISEEADKRSWRTLPSRIYMARIPLPPGKYSVEVRYFGEAGQTIATKKIDLELKKGETRFWQNRIIRTIQ